MEAKHTPGPWSVHSKMRDCVTFEGRHGTENLFLQNLDGYFACQSEADARLIAAAPELLEALKCLKRETILSDVDMDYIKSHFQPWLDKAEAAITKATS